MKKILVFLVLAVPGFACNDDEAKIEQANGLYAVIEDEAWEAETVHTSRASGQNSPLIIRAEGSPYVMEMTLGDIDEVGEYPLGISRHVNIRVGSTTYNTLDVTDAGHVTISLWEDNRVEGFFSFDAHWLSSNNRLRVRGGSFRATLTYY